MTAMTDTTSAADRATDTAHHHTRRAALIGLGATYAAGLTGCTAGPAPRAAPAPGTPVTSTSDIPVGGGRIFGEYDLVVTQPTTGTWAAFSATYTHQSCTVATVEGGNIVRPCHGSRFAVADGAVTTGPATRPLPAKAITVSGASITTA